jgi:hypothetical protein
MDLLMAYSKAKLKSSGDKASPFLRPFWKGNVSDKSDKCYHRFHLNTLISLTGCIKLNENIVQYFPSK